MRCSKGYLAAAAIALAACGRSEDLLPPAPAAVVPASAHTVQPVRIAIRGQHFNLFGERHLGRGTALDTAFQATLGGVALVDVRWVDNQTLEAVVPAGLAGDALDLVLDGPTGHAVLPGAFRATAVPPASLAVAVAAPAQVESAAQFSVTVTIANTGGTAANHVRPSLSASGISFAPPISDLTIEGGSNATVVFLASSSARGPATFAATAEGIDAFSGESLTAAATAGSTVLSPPTVRATARPLPATVTVGQQFTLQIDATNDGDGDAEDVTLSDPHVVGAGSATPVTIASPPQPIPPGQTRAFAWTYLASAAGDLAFDCVGSGTDALTGAPLAFSASWPKIVIQTPAALTSIATVRSSMSVGDQTTLQLDVKNAGDALAFAVVPSLEIAGTGLAALTSPAAQNIPGHQTRTFFWTLAARSPGISTLALQARGIEANTGAAVSTAPPVQPIVSVQAPAQLAAKAAAPAVVSTAQQFAISLDVSNLGDASAGTVSTTATCAGAGTLTPQSAPAPLLLDGRQTRTMAWTFLASSAGRVDCILSASGADTNDGHAVSITQSVSVFVQRAAALEIRSISVPAVVSRGQSFTATALVANTGEAAASAVVASPDPPQVVASGAASAAASPSSAGQDIPGGGTASFVFTFVENGSGAGSLVLHAGAFGSDVNSRATVPAQAVDSTPIAVQIPAALAVTGITVPPSIDRRQQFTVTVEVTNTGGAAALDVLPSPLPLSFTATGGASAAAVTGPSAATIPAGGKAVFGFGYAENGSSAGTLSFSASASGLDANSGQPLLAAALSSAALAVQKPPYLVVSRLTAPEVVTRGQGFTLAATVVNAGEATARCVTAGPPAITFSGGASVQVGLAPVVSQTVRVAVPAVVPIVQTVCTSGVDLAAGQSATFTWSFTENGSASGSLVFAVDASGTDANTGANLSAAPVSATTRVVAPAQLAVTSRSAPGTITRGQHFTTTVVVSNLGEATAVNVHPTPPSPGVTVVSGGANASLTSSLPASVTLAAGESATFAYDYLENGTSSGTLLLSAGATGTDANSNVTVDAPTASSDIWVLDAAQLAIESFSIPSALSRGQAFNLAIRVRNVSSGTLTNVVPASNPPALSATGLASASAPAQPPIASLAPGAVATFTYPAIENGTGTGTIAFSGTVSAIDGGTGLTVSANATSTAAAVVQDPAALGVTSFSLPAGLSRGQTFTATLVVSNTGGATATGVVPDAPALTASGGAHATITASPPAQDIVRGAAATFTWTMVEDGTAAGSLQVATRARGSDVNSPSTQVVSALATAGAAVQEPGRLSLSKMVVPAAISRGQTFTVSVVVTNAGGAQLQAVASPATPSVTAAGGAGAPILKTSTPGKTNLDAGQSTTFFWTYQDGSAASGTLAFSATVTAVDANSGASLTATAPSSSATVQRPALLSIGSFTLASNLGGSSIDRGQAFTAKLVLSNTGEATAVNVLPSPQVPVLLPTGAVSATGAVAPAPVSIAGGASATFTWSYAESGSGPGALQVSTGVAGTDANSASPVTVAAVNSNSLAVVGAPVLAAQSFTLPGTLSRGQTFTASLTIANTGGSGITVLPDPPVLGATGGAHATATASPAATSIAAGGSATFAWSYVEDGSGPGTIALTTRASGIDANTSGTVATASLSTAPATVRSPATLSVTAVSLAGPSGVLAIDRGQTATATVSVQNTGGTAALGVVPSGGAVTATGGAAGSLGAAPSARDLAPGETAAFSLSLAENGTAPGTLQVAFGASGKDANSGLSVSATAVPSNALDVQSPATLSATLSAPPGALPGETFTVSLRVTNGGGAEIRALAPSLAVDSSAAAVASGPAAPATTLAGGASTTYTWSLVAAASGAANLTASVLGTASNTGTALSASAIAPLSASEAALVAGKPFDDDSTFSNVFAYRGYLYAGPNDAGTGGARMQPDGTARETLSFTLDEDTTGFSSLNTTPGPFKSFGAAGCKANTLACGPDNETGRGYFGALSVFGDEWLIGAGSLSAGNFFHFYATTDAMTAPDFSYVDTSALVNNGMRTMTSAAVLGGKLYVALLGTGGVRPGLVALNHGPSAPGLDATSADFSNLQAENIPAIGKSAKTSLIDSMVAFGDRLYLFNNGGCARSNTADPAPGGWTNCTPSGSFPTKTSVTTTKNGDLLPADKAFPAVAIWNGRLVAARNTTVGPQLWMCDPGADGQCAPGDWQLIAANAKLDPNLSQFDDSGNKSISLLAATSSHLYVGFDNAAGVQLYRAQTAAPVNQADFAGASGCNAAQHASGCSGIGGSGLGAGATRFFDGKALTFPSGEQLFVAAGGGAQAARLYRFAQ